MHEPRRLLRTFLLRGRFWFVHPTFRQTGLYVAIGLLITLLLEHLATRSTQEASSWRYSDLMPIVPALGIGLAPLLQWLIIPTMVARFARRQLR